MFSKFGWFKFRAIRSIKRWFSALLRPKPTDYPLKSLGAGVSFGGHVEIKCPQKVNIGSNVHIGENAWINGCGGLTIGDNVLISRNLVLYTSNHNYKGTCLPYDQTLIEKPVTIGKNVWIGMNVCIAPGSQIGDGAIIGMGTVVSGEIPALAIVGSSGWNILKYRDREHYEKLEAQHCYCGRNGVPLRNADILRQDNGRSHKMDKKID